MWALKLSLQMMEILVGNHDGYSTQVILWLLHAVQKDLPSSVNVTFYVPDAIPAYAAFYSNSSVLFNGYKKIVTQ